MPQNKQALRRRIRSVKATKKITSAMELIAASKLQKQKNLMEANRLYASTLHSTINKVLSRADLDDLTFLKEKQGKTLTLIFVSDMGLCGAYNSNVLSFLDTLHQPNKVYMVVGSKGQLWFKHHDLNIQMRILNGDNLNYSQLSKLGEKATRMFEAGEIAKFEVIYTKFVNSMSFEPTIIQLLPLKKDSVSEEPMHQDLILEPNPEELISQLMPMYMNSLLFSLWLESKTSEQAARRLAMDNATDNAQDIIEELVLKFNQSRQAAITQEITEIVSGAQAL